MRARTITTLSLLVALAAVLAGCSQIKQVVTPKPKINKVTIEATVAVPAAPITGKLAAGSPENLPLWPGSVLVRYQSKKVPQGTTWTTTFSTGDPYKDVLNGVGVGFQRAQWQVAAQDMSSLEGSSTVLTVSNSKVEGLVTISDLPTQKIVKIEYDITPR